MALTTITETADKISEMMGGTIEVCIDGPFGAPSSNIFDTEHAVLIATGIGFTPFTSVLLSIIHRYVSSKITCPACQYSFCNGRPLSLNALRKVDFFWINRDQTAFEWFVQILSQLEIEQAELGNNMERFLDLHMYITSALERSDMKASLLQLALDLVYEKEKRDLISGLKSRTNSGRPNWEKIFIQLKEQRKGRVTVFFCGQPAVAKVLEKKCEKFGFEFRQEVF